MSKTFHRGIHHGLFNSQHAARAIAALVATHGTSVYKWAREKNFPFSMTPRYIVLFVDHFMAAHPRGKGTKGDEVLQAAYAACYTIKLQQSERARRVWSRNIISEGSLTRPQKEYLSKLYLDGSMTQRIPGATKTATVLYERGLISGYVNGRGQWTDVCLTDDGISMVPSIIRTLAAVHINEALADPSKCSNIDVESAIERIVRYDRRDVKGFVANARRILPLIEGSLEMAGSE